MASTYTHRVLGSWHHGARKDWTTDALRTEHGSLQAAQRSLRTLERRGFTDLRIEGPRA